MMAPKAVLIFGGSGFLGSHLALRLRDEFKVYLTYHSRPILIPGVTAIPVELKKEAWLKRVFYSTSPDVIIYASGSNDPIWSEANPKDTERMHAVGPADVLNAADILNGADIQQPKFIYLSNCYTFDGSRGNYHETDTLLPSTVLGKAKVAGENFIRGKSLNYCLVRSSPLFGRGLASRPSFFDQLRMQLDAGQRIEVPHQELHSFAPVAGLCDMIVKIIHTNPKKGAFHYGGLTRVTLYELARAFARRYKFDPELIIQKTSASTAKYGDSHLWDYSLNSTLSVQTLKIQPLLLEESLDLI
ncbi:MAG: sugar nucleotide-binding protein [Methylotenera sp.]|nr:sugar nucleotide-binding protein [Oligoflexia bacterium]